MMLMASPPAVYQLPNMTGATGCWQLPPPMPGDGPYDSLLARLLSRFDFCSHEFLDDQLLRAQRGLLCYWLCSEQELERFINRRLFELQRSYSHMHKISSSHVEPDMGLTKLSYIKQLQRADDPRTFRQFTALPRDVRLIVYEFAMLSFPAHEDKDAISQPPITQVSRLLRSESLPLFYQTMRIKIRLIPSHGRFHMNTRTAQWLSAQTKERLMRVRRLAYCADLPEGHHSSNNTRCSKCEHELYVEINLDQHKPEKQLGIMIVDGFRRSKETYHCLRLSSAVQRFLMALKSRDDGRLLHKDFTALMEIVGKAMYCGDHIGSLWCRGRA